MRVPPVSRRRFLKTTAATATSLAVPTIVPARVCGMDDRIGSLEPGKDADLIVVTGHPSDPRHAVERVFIEGREVYDAARRRRW